MRSRIVAVSATLTLAASFVLFLTPAALAQPAATSELPIADCKLESVGVGTFNEGFARDLRAATPTGTLTAQVVFVEFPDLALGAPGNASLEAVRQGIAETEERLETLSEGRLEVDVLEQNDPVMMPKNTTEYPATEDDVFGPAWMPFVVDAVTAAGDSIDFAVSEVVWLFFPWADPLPTRAGADNVVYLPEGGPPVDRAVTLPMVEQDLRATLVHETGHTFGLPDLYDTTRELPQAQYVSDLDLMGLASGGEFFSWHRWRLGWMDDSQVRCIAPGGGVPDVTIGALTRDGPTLAVVIPTSERRALVIESRRPDRFDATISGGVVVYIVSSDVTTGHGPVRIAAKDGTAPPTFYADFERAPLAAGERYTDTISSTRITVMGASEWSDTVRIAATTDATPPPTEPGSPTEPAAAPAHGSAPMLPPTGSDAASALALPAGLLVAGALVVAIGRHRRRSDHA
ncbi:hypothetical protein [Agromyces mariniharenae]|uniref:Gram-positive cocci surface proteins LPxTG domain-containing protein n=1 Tax=Agromyces mariniharenae TaxID=2604423 RepID=A0A5S4VAH1_9MICO|nr:hypothetical protein [Agromyces mariniharenae]TYL54331.1 hypothetical protein FYC51_12280 [Agromyces mariniharenae]